MYGYKKLFKKGRSYNREDGYVAIIVLLISLLIIGFLFVKIYSTPKSPEDKTHVETYNQAIKDAENVKKSIEVRNTDGGF